MTDLPLSPAEQEARRIASREISTTENRFDQGWLAARTFYAEQPEAFAAAQKLEWDAMKRRAESAENRATETQAALEANKRAYDSSMDVANTEIETLCARETASQQRLEEADLRNALLLKTANEKAEELEVSPSDA